MSSVAALLSNERMQPKAAPLPEHVHGRCNPHAFSCCFEIHPNFCELCPPRCVTEDDDKVCAIFECLSRHHEHNIFQVIRRSLFLCCLFAQNTSLFVFLFLLGRSRSCGGGACHVCQGKSCVFLFFLSPVSFVAILSASAKISSIVCNVNKIFSRRRHFFEPNADKQTFQEKKPSTRREVTGHGMSQLCAGASRSVYTILENFRHI